jgi:hypothetical protein
VNRDTPILAGLRLIPMLGVSALGVAYFSFHLKLMLIASREHPWWSTLVQEEHHFALTHYRSLLRAAWVWTAVNSLA